MENCPSLLYLVVVFWGFILILLVGLIPLPFHFVSLSVIVFSVPGAVRLLFFLLLLSVLFNKNFYYQLFELQV